VQILSDPRLQPEKSPRHSPIAAVVLTSADVDQVMGLLHLREFQPLQIYATASIRRILRGENSIFAALEQSDRQAKWETMRAGVQEDVRSADGGSLNIAIEAISVGGNYPGYARKPDRARPHAVSDSADAVVGLFIEADGRKIFCAPSMPRIDPCWLAELDKCDALLIDGTFWSDDELVRTRSEGKTARQMGHVPISGSGGTLETFARVTQARKIFYHINNTNPILDEDSTEHREVTSSGWEIARDSMEIEL
jgi:pyrroloquinoline quinone biosynthesis protein B